MEIHYVLSWPVKLDVRVRVEGFTVVLGLSGEGKTSLLKAIAGLLPARGQPFGGLPPERRPVGYLPQHCALFPHLRVWQNVAFPLGGRQADKRRRALELLDRVGIADLADRFPNELSGGQKQRVALARALAREPDLLLLDEPTSALDPSTREYVMAEVVSLIRGTGMPVLAVSHDPAISRLADWLAVLEGGRVVQEGPPTEVFSRPATLGVARLVGVDNLLEGRITRVSSPWVVVETALGPLRAPCASWMASGARVVVAVHGRDPLVGPTAEEGSLAAGEGRSHPPEGQVPDGWPANRLRGRVERVHWHGPEVRLKVQAGGRLEVTVPRSLFSQLGVEVGKPVQVTLDPRFVHVLPDAPKNGSLQAEEGRPAHAKGEV